MDFRKSKIILEKITALHNSMSSDADHVSSIEVDLMKSYIRELYETFLHLPSNAAHLDSQVEVIKAGKGAEPLPVQKQSTAPPPTMQFTPSAPAEPITPVQPSPVKTESAAPSAIASQIEEKPQPKITTRPPVSPELEELFAFETAKELSEKLGQMPIADIRKAMGLNERIFTVNELFGGDKEAFDATLSVLNKLNSFEEAKAYLMQGVATKYNWTERDRVKKAKAFIKLVKRRYN